MGRLTLIVLIVLKLRLIGCSIGLTEPIANSYLGISAFAATSNRFPCSTYLKYQNRFNQPVMPILVGTFGYSSKCVRRFMRTNAHKPHIVQLFLSNGPCRWNSRCGRYEMTPWFNARWASRYVVRRGNQNTTFILAPILEDRVSTKRFNRVHDKVSRLVREQTDREFLTLRNPVYGKSRSFADFLELHTVWMRYSKADFISNDGTEVALPDIPRYYNRHAKSLALVLWDGTLQGVGASFVDPRERRFYFSNELKRKCNVLIKKEKHEFSW